MKERKTLENQKTEYDEEFMDQFTKEAFQVEDHVTRGKREIVQLKKPDNLVEKTDWDKIIKSNFPDLWNVADITLAGAGQLLIKDIVNPFGLVLVDKPSSGKTIVLNFFDNLDDELVYPVDNFSPASFVTHAANKPSVTLESIDMLPKIKDKILLVRDLAPIFSLRDDDLQKQMGTLTRVFDGEGLQSNTGVHGKRGYKGTYMFAFLAASTPIRPRIWKTMSTLGSRLFFVNVGSKEKSIDTLADQLITRSFKAKEKECRKVTADLIRTLWEKYPKGIKWDHSKTNRKYILDISRIAVMLAKFRGSVSVWQISDSQDGGERKDRFNHTIPEDERPDRINQILYNFARGHAVICGRDILKRIDIKAVLRLALESAPYHRTQLFKALVAKGGQIDTEGAMELFGCSAPTAHKEMEYLSTLGLVEKLSYGGRDENDKFITKHRIVLKPELRWLVDECLKDWPDLFQV